MTLRSPTDGFVIERDVVPGNLYDENDTLLVIAPLDRLWVWGNVFESDLDLVKLGQSWEIRFPFLEQKLQGKVEYISNRVDPNTHAVRVQNVDPQPRGSAQVRHARSRHARNPARARADGHPEDGPDRGRRPLLRLRPGGRQAGQVRAPSRRSRPGERRSRRDRRAA